MSKRIVAILFILAYFPILSQNNLEATDGYFSSIENLTTTSIASYNTSDFDSETLKKAAKITRRKDSI